MKNKINNQKGGFLRLIIIIVIAFLLMQHFHINISDVINWFKNVINSFNK